MSEFESKKAAKARELFMEGYNCSQSVFGAFAEDIGLDFETAMKLSSSFGGGMGRLREVCGAVSAMFMIAGLIYGYSDPGEYNLKAQHYKRIQELATEFKKKHGTIICRELLGLTVEGADDPLPEKRTSEYYAKRPCPDIIASATEIIAGYIDTNK